MRRPFGRVQSASVRPSGSGSCAMSSSPLAMPSTRASVSVSRSRNAGVPPQAARSVALAASISPDCTRSAAAIARNAALRSASGKRARICEAARAALAARCRCWVASVSMCMAASPLYVRADCAHSGAILLVDQSPHASDCTNGQENGVVLREPGKLHLHAGVGLQHPSTAFEDVCLRRMKPCKIGRATSLVGPSVIKHALRFSQKLSRTFGERLPTPAS